MSFITSEGLELATESRRIVSSKRGSYYEFDDEHILKVNIYVPEEEEWRLTTDYVYYHEYRSCDDAYVKLYYQRRFVSYADYWVGRWYISVDDVTEVDN